MCINIIKMHAQEWSALAHCHCRMKYLTMVWAVVRRSLLWLFHVLSNYEFSYITSANCVRECPRTGIPRRVLPFYDANYFNKNTPHNSNRRADKEQKSGKSLSHWFALSQSMATKRFFVFCYGRTHKYVDLFDLLL